MIRCYESFVDEDALVIVMEYASGLIPASHANVQSRYALRWRFESISDRTRW